MFSMRNLIRTLMRAGRDSDVWPVALLLFAVVVPAVSLLWFMNAAMRNERLATRQKWAEIFRPQLLSSQAYLDQHWHDLGVQLEELARTNSPPVAFAKAVESGLVDSVILFSPEGRLVYPNVASAIPTEELDRRWADAGRLEHRERDFSNAARLYDALAREATNANIAARAWQAKARCLVHAGQKDAAVRLVVETFGEPRYRQAVDPQGRLIAANVEMMAYEFSHNEELRRRLGERLNDYANPALAAPQRRFLMKELQTSSPEFPTLAAEELATQVPLPVRDSTGDRIPGTDLWYRTTPNGRVVALFCGALLPARLEPFWSNN